eukprot:m.622128 g.622128  ORF g.622128 m.622128 type:complete len:305 (-) comp58217_c0_seq6:1618-2532(-)
MRFPTRADFRAARDALPTGADVRAAIDSLPTAKQTGRWLYHYAPELPIIHWLPRYTREDVPGDLVAGFTIGAMVVPQALSFAISVAGLPGENGLYAAFAGLLFYMFLGTSKDITIGPTAIMSLITASTCVGPDGKTSVEYAIFMSFFAGILQMILGIFRLGILIDFVSEPILSAFTSAAAFIIGSSQLKRLFGMSYSENRQDILNQLKAFFKNVKIKYNKHDLGLGFGCIIFLVILQMISRRTDKSKTILGRLTWLIATCAFLSLPFSSFLWFSSSLSFSSFLFLSPLSSFLFLLLLLRSDCVE